VLKPLLFWAGAAAQPFVVDRAAWAALAQPAVTHSENDPTAQLWSRVGERQLLATIRERTGIGWRTERSGAQAWRRVLITAHELALAYAAFAADDGDAAMQLRAWMRDVPAEQTFGARQVACDVLDVADASVGVKCGWFAVVRTHAVTLVELPDRTLGAAVTFRPQDPAGRAAYAAAHGSGAQVLAVHDAFAGPSVRSGIRQGLEAAAAL
jgi:hypothetical protein